MDGVSEIAYVLGRRLRLRFLCACRAEYRRVEKFGVFDEAAELFLAGLMDGAFFGVGISRGFVGDLGAGPLGDPVVFVALLPDLSLFEPHGFL